MADTLQRAYEAWNTFDFESFRQSNDEDTQIARQRHAAARKNLADLTKQFRKALKVAEDSVVSGISGDPNTSFETAVSAITTDQTIAGVDSQALIRQMAKQGKQTVRAYQEEIDCLAKHNKQLIHFKEALINLPNPAVVLLEALNERNQLLSDTYNDTTDQQQLEQELNALKLQLDEKFKRECDSLREDVARANQLLEHSNVNLEQEREEFRQVVNSKDSEIHHLQQSLERMNEVQIENDDSQQKFHQLQEENQILLQRLANLEARNQELLESNKLLNTQNQDLVAQKDIQVSEIQANEQKLLQQLTEKNTELVDEIEALLVQSKKDAATKAQTAEEMTQLKKEKDAIILQNKRQDEEISRLQMDVEEYETEFQNVKNQDITIRKLENKIAQLQEQGMKSVEVQKIQEEITESENKRLNEALEREAELQRKLENIEVELKAEKAGRAATQTHLLEVDEGAAELEAAWEAQRQILVQDSERLRETVHILTRERDDLKLQAVTAMESNGGGITSPSGAISSLSSQVTDSSSSLIPSAAGSTFSPQQQAQTLAAYESEINELVLTISSLREGLHQKESELMALTDRNKQNLMEKEEIEQKLTIQINELNARLDELPTPEAIEQMRAELRILKKLEYNAEEDDGADDTKDPEKTHLSSSEKYNNINDIESIVVARVKKLEAGLLREKRERRELLNAYDNLKDELRKMEEMKTAAESLVTTLEADLQKAIIAAAAAKKNNVQVTKPDNGSSFADEDATTVDDTATTLQRILETSPLSASVSGELAMNNNEALDETQQHLLSKIKKASEEESVASIIMAQRDRLRAKCDTLEAERDSFKKELQVQVRASEALKSDNTKLYEKVRFLQHQTSSSQQALDSSMIDVESLERRYEASVDPFRQFSAMERQRKLKEMTPVERIVFISAKMVLGTKEARTFLFFYLMGMHLLVFVTTYHWSHELHSCGMMDLHNNEALAHLHHGPPKIE